jgi:hypothetical protein
VIGTGTGGLPVMEEVNREAIFPENQAPDIADRRGYQNPGEAPRKD